MSRHIHQRPPDTNLTFLQGQRIEARLDRKMNELSSNCKQAHPSHLKEALGLSCFNDICFNAHWSRPLCRSAISGAIWPYIKDSKNLSLPLSYGMEFGLFLNKKFVNMKRVFREFIHTEKSTFILLKKSWVCDHYQQSNLICVCAAHCKLSWRMGVISNK